MKAEQGDSPVVLMRGTAFRVTRQHRAEPPSSCNHSAPISYKEIDGKSGWNGGNGGRMPLLIPC